MSRFKYFSLCVVLAYLLIIVFANGLYYFRDNESAGRIYLVEARRLIQEIKDKNLNIDEADKTLFDKYDTIVGISEFVPGEACANDYLVEEINGRLYRIEYNAEKKRQPVLYLNTALFGVLAVMILALAYVYHKVLKPFHVMSNLSYELAKGNLSMPVKEEKSRLFGRFLWGMDMLREKLEDNKEKELALHKERKTLILSLSHDIKTPLSSIELYTKALSENLYDTEEKRAAALSGIKRNVGEIKGYVNEIAAASREDFLNLEVNMGEFYLQEVVSITEAYYRDKLSVMHTELTVDEIKDCLVRGDRDRIVEVLQNVMENAIKYGDGKWIRISAEDEEDCKLIHIENSGCTLKQEELPGIFDSFYRGSNSSNVKGNGLGLYICRTLMRKMEGEIFAQTKDESFVVTIVIRMA